VATQIRNTSCVSRSVFASEKVGVGLVGVLYTTVYRLFAVEGVTVVGAGAALLLVGLPGWFGVEEVGGEGCGDRFA
jgi:hypothetical protein